jgi:dTMP kinase
MAARGAFILFEGVDRCGKTTQATKLVEALTKAGQKAVLMRFPGASRFRKVPV